MNRREELLIAALVEYIQKYGNSEKAKEALNVIGAEVFQEAMSSLK